MIRSLFLTLCAMFGGCAEAAPSADGTPATAPAAIVRNIDVAALRADLDRGVVRLLIDVRTTGEYAGGHVPGAKNVPLDQLDARIGEFGTAEHEVYVICQSGARSGRAGAALAAKGLRPVNVTGGTGAWKAAGFPVE